MEILIGTRNQFKVNEMLGFLKGVKGIKIHFLNELPETIKVEEDGETLTANAEKKAIEISKHTDWYILASDGGNDIPGLEDKWDVLRNQRIVGETKTDREKVDTLLDLMTSLKGEERRCNCYLALALAKKGKLLWSISDQIDSGYIVEKADDKEIPPYLWMGHVWYYPKFNKTFNQLDENQKEEVRSQSKRLKEELQKFLKGIL